MNHCGIAAEARPFLRTPIRSNDMITARGTFRLLGVATLVLFAGFFGRSNVIGAENELRAAPSPPAQADRRAPLQQTRVEPNLRRVRQPSMLASAAEGRVISEIPSAALVDSGVEPVGFMSSGGCGPVCDCAECDPGCGVEAACGVEAVCGVEAAPGNGVELGCGIGAALDRFNSCGVEGCTDCCESVCGVEEIFVEGPGCGMEAMGDCSCDACAGGYEVDTLPLFLPMMRINWSRFQFFVGSQGFKGPLNFASVDSNNPAVQSGSGSFGFYQGFNIGHAFKTMRRFGIAGQFGLRATQSNFSGADFTEDKRYQIFLTTGLFRRVDNGLQYGVVFDYLNQDWYFQSDHMQMRGELSWKTRGCHVFGFRATGAFHNGNSSTILRDSSGNRFGSSLSYGGTDQYRFFYRYLLACGGQWDAFGGWTDKDDGLVGASFNVALHHKLSLATTTTFLIPREGDESGGNREEGWNLGIGIVYRPGGPKGCGRYGEPLFDVADNGSLLVDLR